MTTGFFRRIIIVNPLRFEVGKIYYIKKPEDKKFRKSLCYLIHPHYVMFSYLLEKYPGSELELKMYRIYKDELENHDYIIMGIKD